MTVVSWQKKVKKTLNPPCFNTILQVEEVKIVKNACSTAESSSFDLSENLPEKLNIFFRL